MFLRREQRYAPLALEIASNPPLVEFLHPVFNFKSEADRSVYP